MGMSIDQHLNLLLEFGYDPLTVDTATGFAGRIGRPVPAVRKALERLRDADVLRVSTRGGDGEQCFWLSHDESVLAALRHLLSTYRARPARGKALFRALFPRPARPQADTTQEQPNDMKHTDVTGGATGGGVSLPPPAR